MSISLHEPDELQLNFKTISSVDSVDFTSELICSDFPIQVRSLTGKHTEIKAHHKMTVAELKDKIQEADQTPLDQQRLVYNGKQLEDERTLDYYNIIKGTIIHIILRIRGGMFHETSARKDFQLIQCGCFESIEEIEEQLRILKALHNIK